MTTQGLMSAHWDAQQHQPFEWWASFESAPCGCKRVTGACGASPYAVGEIVPYAAYENHPCRRWFRKHQPAGRA